MTDPIPDPLAAAEQALARLSGSQKRNRAQRRRHWGPAAGAGKHPLGATRQLASEKAAKRRKRKRSR